MPTAQTMLTRLNASFGTGLNDLPLELFEQGTKLSRAAAAMELDQDGLAAYLDRIPEGVHEAIRGAIYSALSRDQRQMVTFAWAPAFDWEVTVWDVGDTKVTRGGMTILVKSPYDR